MAPELHRKNPCYQIPAIVIVLQHIVSGNTQILSVVKKDLLPIHVQRYQGLSFLYPKTHRVLDHGIVTTDETGGMPCHSFHNLYKYKVNSSEIMVSQQISLAYK